MTFRSEVTPLERLEAMGGRTLRAFYRAPDPGNHRDTELYDAFLNLLFDGVDSVDRETTLRVNYEIAHSDHTIQEVLDGWRPEALNG